MCGMARGVASSKEVAGQAGVRETNATLFIAEAVPIASDPATACTRPL